MEPRYRTDVHDSARWDGFPWRPGDIVISPPPKCGTTWVQMICALLIFQTPALDRPLDQVSPRLDALAVDRQEALATLEGQHHRRFIKTHTPLDGLAFKEETSYLCVGRDPRDVAVSWDNHLANTDMVAFARARRSATGAGHVADAPSAGLPPMWADNVRKRFWRWVDDPTPPTETDSSLVSTLHHLQSFWEARYRPNVVLLHYADLKDDLAAQMRRLADRLSISIPDAKWPALVEAATFERMRARADELVPNASRHVFKDNRRFFASGTVGQWRAVLVDDADLARYHARVAELVAPDLAAWVHHA
ncbi:MAG TPA: sulfotransferase domain-containing protein [Acidimicrobiales bacterium]|nr:sulfotransferase domain-containing protein [Acidimicrobiales bacterium]